MNHLKKILKWLKLSGVKSDNKPSLPSKQQFDLWYRLMQEELEETKKAFEAGNLIEFIDGVVDLQWVHANIIAMASLEKDYDAFFEAVEKSNYSKFCKSKQEAIEAVENYKKKSIDTYYEKTGKYFIVKRSSDNKILKSPRWIPPKISI